MLKFHIKIFLLLFIFFFQLSLPSFSMEDEDDNSNNGGHLQVYCPYCIGLRSDCLDLKVNGKGASGKWLDKVTPKRGWQCTGAADLGDGNLQQCQMCEREQVRYIHHMIHGDQNPLRLDVGCICSGYMEGLLDTPQYVQNAKVRAQGRTTTLQNRTARRNNFPNLNWKTSTKGNQYIIKDGNTIIIVRSIYNKYSAVINKVSLNRWVNTENEAKFAAFDFLYPPVVQ